MPTAPENHRTPRTYWTGPVFSELIIALLPLLNFYAFVYPRLPVQVALHFDENMIANRFADKDSMEVFISMALTGLFGFLFGKILRIIILTIAHFQQNENNKRVFAQVMNYLEFFIVILFSAISLSIQSLGLGYRDDSDFSIKIIFIGLNLCLVLIGNISPKISPNKWFGIRTPYAFSSDAAWVSVQRFGGKILFWGGLFNILVTLLLPLSFKVIHTFNIVSILLQVALIFVWKEKIRKAPAPPKHS